MTTSAGPVLLDLPEGFLVLDAADRSLVDVADLPQPLAGWYAEVTAASARAGAALVAVQLEPSPAGPHELTAVSLAVHLLPLHPVPAEVAVQGLRALALSRTSAAGEVGVLDLPVGPAVGAADVVSHDEQTAAVATVQVPLPALGQLLTLTLSTPATHRLAACAAVAAAVALRIRPADPETSP